MRLGVLDIGSNTVHLLVVDAHPGARPYPATSHKVVLRLAEHLLDDGSVSATGSRLLVDFILECLTVAEDQGVQELLPFATSAIREAPNGAEVLAEVAEKTGVELQVLSGQMEANLTFLAVRRWFGWSSGRLLGLDIGGGSLELATGIDEFPDYSVSLPLGAGRLTRMFLPGNPPDAEAVREARKYVRSEIATVVRDLSRFGEPDRAVGTSKTFRTLARVCGAAPSADGAYVPRHLEFLALQDLVSRLGTLSYEERIELPGVSESRAPQLLAGALVAEAGMELLGVDRLEVCPWALREGLILRRIDAESTDELIAHMSDAPTKM